MPKGHKIRDEDKLALVDLVKEEIAVHQEGRLDRFSTNTELAEAANFSKVAVSRCLKGLPKQERDYRTTGIRNATGRSNPNYGNDVLAKLDKRARAELISRVSQEIDSYDSGTVCHLSTNEELARDYSSQNVTAHNIACYISESDIRKLPRAKALSVLSCKIN
ncbi:MAG: hypothetical protein KKE05_03255, partial [Nanoarchaeota archaeon]|nr:hypothetical protein [Nanoarchaeota archaeon]